MQTVYLKKQQQFQQIAKTICDGAGGVSFVCFGRVFGTRRKIVFLKLTETTVIVNRTPVNRKCF